MNIFIHPGNLRLQLWFWFLLNYGQPKSLDYDNFNHLINVISKCGVGVEMWLYHVGL